MSKTKQLSQYNGTAWETPIDIGADAANVDYPLSDDTTKPLDEVIGSVGASDSNLVTQINGKLSTNGAIDNTVLNQGPDITTYPTSGQVNDGNLVVSAGDSSRTLWSKFNAFRGRVASNFSNYIKATLVTSGTGVSSSATDEQVYSAKAIQNYFNSVIGYNSASDVSSFGSVASQLSSLNSNIETKQNQFLSDTITGTTDAYGFLNSGINISTTQIMCATVTSDAGYGVVPIRRDRTWQFSIFAIGAVIPNINSRYIISVGQSQFSVSFLKTK